MSVAKTYDIRNKMLLTAQGSLDTLISSPSAEYSGITLGQIAAMVDTPQATDKAKAAFVIPSTYRAHDGRNHATQREHGEYWMLAVDVDKGSPEQDDLLNAVKSITGDAAALIYSSSGATAENRKWRVLIPLAQPLTGVEYIDAQLALFDIMQSDHGIECDAALSRTGQPIYLPNVPPEKREIDGSPEFYSAAKHRGQGYLVVKESRIWAKAQFRAKQAEIAEQQAAAMRQQRQAARDERRQKIGNDVDPVAEFNERHVIADLFLKYGYERQGQSDSYRSPNQSSGSFATKDFGTHWVSLSGSDANAGIGQCKLGDVTMAWGDAFDLYCHFEHSGDMKNAVRDYAKELRPNNYAEQREQIMKEAMCAPKDHSLNDFDFVPPDPQPEPTHSGIIIPNEDRKPIFWIKDAQPVLRSSYLIKNWLGRGQMSAVYGPSNVGKSFFCLDMAFCVAAGIEWQGAKVRKGPVLYLATEGGNAFQSRCVALREEYGMSDVPLAVRPSPIDLLRPDVDMASLIKLCQDIEQQLGEPLAMICVDTLSRAMAGGDENGAVDMTAFIANIDALRDVTGAAIMIVHHSGKDVSKGQRGHSSLRAAVDTEIELAVDQGIRMATATKQRDLEPQEPIMFVLKVHKLGVDEDGDDVTTCTITAANEDDVAEMKQKKPTGANQKTVVNAFKQLRGEGVGSSNPTGAGWPESGRYWTIEEAELAEFAKGKMTSANPRGAYSAAIKSLIESGYMVQNEGKIWISAKEGRMK